MSFKKVFGAAAGVMVACSISVAHAQTTGQEDQAPAASAPEIPLYPGAAPGSEAWDWAERTVTAHGMPIAHDVVRPVLLHYPADRNKSVGTAVIVAPGGGFRALMMSYEGVDVARRLNTMGVDAFVLKYRLIYTGPRTAEDDPRPAPKSATAERPRKFTLKGDYKGQAGQDVAALASDDGRRAVRLLRERAEDFGFRPDRVGMIGFSAGGRVTSEAVFGPAETRPDFAGLIYGPGDVQEAPKPTPPLFIAAAADDARAAAGSIELFSAWRQAKGPAELHIFQTGAARVREQGGARTITWTDSRNGSRSTRF